MRFGAVGQKSLMLVTMLSLSASVARASVWFCQNQPQYLHDDGTNPSYYVEVRLTAEIVKPRGRWTLRDYQVYASIADQDTPTGEAGEWRAVGVEFAHAREISDDPNYRPELYKDHARFLKRTERGNLNLIFPKLDNLAERREVRAILDMKYENFGTYVPLLCERRRGITPERK